MNKTLQLPSTGAGSVAEQNGCATHWDADFTYRFSGKRFAARRGCDEVIRIVNHKFFMIFLRYIVFVVLVAFPMVSSAGTVTLQTSSPGSTPSLLGYNSGHFFTNSNTKEWWRYSGVTGARIFISPSTIELSDDIAPVGDGVTDQNSFVARKAALRADPFNPAYINWSYFSTRLKVAYGFPSTST